jgi:hypothetical protein
MNNEGISSGPATAASSAEGKALLTKVIEAMGGKQRTFELRAIHVKATSVRKSAQGDVTIQVESIEVFPDRRWEKLDMPTGAIYAVAGPSAAFVTGPMGSQDMSPSQKQEFLAGGTFFIAQRADDPKFTFCAGDKVKVGDVEAQVLDVNADGYAVRWFVDLASGHIVRRSAQISPGGVPVEEVIDCSDWRLVDGISLPFKEVKTCNEQPEASLEVQEVELNPKVDDSLFEKPAAKPNP